MRSIRRKLAASLLAATAGALALPGVAAEVIEISTPTTTRYYYETAPSVTRYYYDPATATYYSAPVTTYSAPVTTYSAPVATYSAPLATTTYYAAPVTEVVYAEPAITVYGRPLNDDLRITQDVAGAIAHDPYISGRIGVETRDNEVTLSGSTTTPSQARRAARDAYSVPGVRNVSNEIRPKVGGLP